jgi:5-methylcytosine-specific restriction protein A
MALADITRRAIVQAIKEFERLGRQAFLERYGFGEARDYFLLHKRKRYDSKLRRRGHR